MNLEARLQDAIQHYWDARQAQRQKQLDHGTIDAGSRADVTGGSQMGALEVLAVDILEEAGLNRLHVRRNTGLELPGYYRPEKRWDLIVVVEYQSQKQLVAAIEFKSQVGPSFGNNFNNRVEEAIGNADDLWTAYREGLLGTAPRPLLGYLFLLEDCPQVHSTVGLKQPHFPADPVFAASSYSQRYEIFCRRLVRERLYDTACLVLATRGAHTQIAQPTADLDFSRFAVELRACAIRFQQDR